MKTVTWIGGVLAVCGVILLAASLGTLTGAVSGWLVGLVFPHSMALLSQAIGVPTATPLELGAMFGFVGGFFRSTASSSSK